jgi:peptidoglycan hydrolase-like protein with peptidoglycan-binding domain
MRRSLKTLLSRVLLVGLLVFGSGSLRADEALRRIQQALREQGFYYGSIDGSPGDETTQAIRRFQIRNGLAVTGQLNEETRKAIEKPGSVSGKTRNGTINGNSNSNATPPPLRPRPADPKLDEDRNYANGRPPANPPSPSNNNRNNDDDDEDTAPVRPPPRAPDRSDLRVAPPQPPEPPSPRYGVPPSRTLTDLFEDTPYELAPPPVQADILRRAQIALLRSGFYGGQPDGVPGSMTTQALAEFQSANRLRRTGRLDETTLAYLRLLPNRSIAPSRRYEERRFDGPRPPRVIFEGRIVP